MTDQYRAQALIDTREQAASLLDDLQHFKIVLSTVEPTRGEIRALTSILRRLLLERSLTIVAAPRIGEFQFESFDNKEATKEKLAFYWMGGYAPLRLIKVDPPQDYVPPPPPKMIKLKREGFLSQRVIFNTNTWINRKDILEYVAYRASGIHAPDKTPLTETERAIEFLYHHSSYTDEGISMNVPFNQPPPSSIDPNYSESMRKPRDVDMILLELLGMVKFIVEASDTQKLVEYINDELSNSRRTPA